MIKNVGAVLLLLAFYVNSDAQTFSINNIKECTPDSIYLTKPVWNNSGDKLVLTGMHNSGVYLFDLSKNTLSCLSENTRLNLRPQWLKNGEIVWFEKSGLITSSTFKSVGNKSGSDTLVFLNVKKRQVEAMTLPENKSWNITRNKALYYDPVLSPDGKKVVIHLKSEMYLFATDGSGLIRHLRTGLASSWTSDSKYILYFKDESSNGHEISNSDIYILSANGLFNLKLTNTSDLFEMWPTVSPDGNRITFSDEKTGIIYIADFNKAIK